MNRLKQKLDEELMKFVPYNADIERKILVRKSRKKKNPWTYSVILTAFALFTIGFVWLLLNENFTERQLTTTSLPLGVEVEAFIADLPEDREGLFGSKGYKKVNSVLKHGNENVELWLIEDYYTNEGDYTESKLIHSYHEVEGDELVNEMQHMVIENSPQTVLLDDLNTLVSKNLTRKEERLVKKQIEKLIVTNKQTDLRYLSRVDFTNYGQDKMLYKDDEILKIKSALANIEWQEGVQREVTRKNDLEATLFIQYDKNEPARLLNYRIWINNGLVEIQDEANYGRLTQKEAVASLKELFLISD